MNLDVPLDDLIKSRPKRGAIGRRARGATRAPPTRGKDPFSVPLNTLIAGKPRGGGGGPAPRGRSRSARGSSIARGNSSRRYFSQSSPVRQRAATATTVAKKVVKRPASSGRQGVVLSSASRYSSKGLAGRANRERRVTAVARPRVAASNLSINRRRPTSNTAPTYSARPNEQVAYNGSNRYNTSRTQLTTRAPAHLRSPQASIRSPGGARSIAFQQRNATVWAPQVPIAAAELLPYQTGLTSNIHRQAVEVGQSQVGTSLYEKTIATSTMDQDDSLFSDKDRQMFRKIKIMAQLDSIPTPTGAAQRHHSHQMPNSTDLTGAPRYRTLSESFMS